MKEHAAVVNTADVFEGASLNHREKKKRHTDNDEEERGLQINDNNSNTKLSCHRHLQ